MEEISNVIYYCKGVFLFSTSWWLKWKLFRWKLVLWIFSKIFPCISVCGIYTSIRLWACLFAFSPFINNLVPYACKSTLQLLSYGERYHCSWITKLHISSPELPNNISVLLNCQTTYQFFWITKHHISSPELPKKTYQLSWVTKKTYQFTWITKKKLIS